jgi:PPOX class probable F420-dependent enzyme
VSSLTSSRARELFVGARVAALSTMGQRGPHLVPVVFAVAGDIVYSAVDHKPKKTTALQRLTNIREVSDAALLVHDYDDADWGALWWVRADGLGRVLTPDQPEAVAAVEELRAKYPQHAEHPPSGPVLAIDVLRWSGWSARPN